jgi:hypothetical protein
MQSNPVVSVNIVLNFDVGKKNKLFLFIIFISAYILRYTQNNDGEDMGSNKI